MNRDFAEQFAREWVEVWNSHDMDAIMAHYADDLMVSSPVISQLMGEPSGALKGKAAVRDYWSRALAKIPDLHFELLQVFSGASSIIIHYRGHRGLSSEMFKFNADGLVQEVYAHYE